MRNERLKNLGVAVLAALVLFVCGGAARADVKIKSRQTTNGQTYENTTYIQGKRQRAENAGGQSVTITQCDLKRSVQLVPQTKAYVVTQYGTATAPETVAGNDAPQGRGGVVISTVTLKDTGERKKIFGYTARHILTKIVMESSPDACSPVNVKLEIDGWYIDVGFGDGCGGNLDYSAYNGGAQKPSCQDRYKTKTIGTGVKGYPVYEKTTIFGDDGNALVATENEVTEISPSIADPTLFEIPADYREVKDLAAAYAVTNQTPRYNVNQNNGAPNNAAINPTANSGAKRTGVIRIGIVNVNVTKVGDSISASDLANAVRSTLAAQLQTSDVEVVTLAANDLSQAATEARAKDCDYVVSANVAHKKGGGGLFGSVIAPAIVQTGIGHTGSTAGNIAGQVATNAVAVAADIKAKDEITLDLKLQRADGSPALARQFKAKAKSDGEDIVTTVATQAAQAVRSTTGK